ncbi:hypothetical protein ACOSQ4_029502 [Xanthoceras sorbifolium]
MFSKSPDLVQNSLQIKQEEKFYSRILSKLENSMSNPSFRFHNYEGKPGAVPFLWESQPGTPKCSFNETSLLPPLTPPPSYYYFNSNEKPIKKTSSSRLLHVLFSKMITNHKKSNSSVSSSSSLSSSSSSWSSSSNLSTVVSVTSPKKYQHSRRGWRRSSFDSRVAYHEEGHQAEEIGSSPTSTSCFSGIGKGSSRQ